MTVMIHPIIIIIIVIIIISRPRLTDRHGCIPSGQVRVLRRQRHDGL
jgi:hypothetical protein